MIPHQSKLNNFPPVFVVSVDCSEDRRKYLNEQLEQYEINNIYYRLFSLWDKDKYVVTGRNLEDLHIGSYGPATSHILINEYWTKNTSYDYVVIMEDDVSFEFVNMWNFTWEDFFDDLPEDWGLVQLSTMRDNIDDIDIELRQRHNRDLGCQIYLIKRNYAEELVRRYRTKDGFDLSIPEADILYRENDFWEKCNLVPYVENIVYESIGKTYACCLFYEKLEFQTLSQGKTEKEEWRSACYHRFLDLWKKYAGNYKKRV